MTEEEFAIFEFNEAEEEYLSELSNEEQLTYFKDQYGTEGQVRQADKDAKKQDTSVQRSPGGKSEAKPTGKQRGEKRKKLVEVSN